MYGIISFQLSPLSVQRVHYWDENIILIRFNNLSSVLYFPWRDLVELRAWEEIAYIYNGIVFPCIQTELQMLYFQEINTITHSREDLKRKSMIWLSYNHFSAIKSDLFDFLKTTNYFLFCAETV